MDHLLIQTARGIALGYGRFRHGLAGLALGQRRATLLCNFLRRLLYKEHTRTHAEGADPKVWGLARAGLRVAWSPAISRIRLSHKTMPVFFSSDCFWWIPCLYRLRVVSRLGRGAFGTAWLVSHAGSGGQRYYALKVMEKESPLIKKKARRNSDDGRSQDGERTKEKDDKTQRWAIYIYIYMLMYSCIYVCICMYVCMYMYVCIYVYICTYI